MMLEPHCREYTAFTEPGLGQFEWVLAEMADPFAVGQNTRTFLSIVVIIIFQLETVRFETLTFRVPV